MVVSFVKGIPLSFGKVAGSILILAFLGDFLHSFYEEKKGVFPEWKKILTERFRG